jgi:hypothetical protein
MDYSKNLIRTYSIRLKGEIYMSHHHGNNCGCNGNSGFGGGNSSWLWIGVVVVVLIACGGNQRGCNNNCRNIC